MIQKLSVFALFCVIAAASLESVPLSRPAGEESCSEDHTKWVAEALERMETIKPGMTRQDLLGVFTTEGGFPPVCAEHTSARIAPIGRWTSNSRPLVVLPAMGMEE